MKKIQSSILALFALVFVELAFVSLTASLVGVSSAHAADVVGNAQAGKGKIAMCIGCHGIPGYRASFPQTHRVPKISGQTAAYLVSALEQYRGGERSHPSMKAVAAPLSDQDIADIAAYYSGHGVDAKAATLVAENPPAAIAQLIQRDAANACTKCHGVNFSTPNDGTVPKIAGQHADYLYVALKSYHSQPSALVGRNNAVMQGVAKKFTRKELHQLADYIGGLPGDLKTVPQSRVRK